MRVKNREIINKITEYVNAFQRKNGRSPSTTEIAAEVGVARGTAYTYLVYMKERNMIEYDGKDIKTSLSEKVNHLTVSVPVVGRVVCGDPNEEEENTEEFVDLPCSIFGREDMFLLQAYGDSMDRCGIEEGDMLVVRKTHEASDGDLVIALTNGENNCKRIFFDRKKGVCRLVPESSNPIYKEKEYHGVVVQGVVTHIIKKTSQRRI